MLSSCLRPRAARYAGTVRTRLLLILLLTQWAAAQNNPSRAAQREAAATSAMKVHVIRLHPGEDLLLALTAYARENGIRASVVLTTVGSLTVTSLRLADRPTSTVLKDKAEIVSLVGTLDARSAHLHLSVSDGRGRTTGGHLMEGCRIYTTAEIALGELPDLAFSREPDSTSGYEELKIDKAR
jgi:uncharacterized protein